MRSDEANMNNRRQMSSQAIMGHQVNNTVSTSATNVHKTPPNTPDPPTTDPFLTPQPGDGVNGTETEQGMKNNNAKIRKQISWRPAENIEPHYDEVNGDNEENEDSSLPQSDVITYADNALFQSESIGVEFRKH